MSEQPQSTDTLSISDNAAKRIALLASKEKNADSKLRVAVDGGGCSGFQYRFGFETDANNDDIVIQKDGANVLVDEMSMEFLVGSELDFIEELGGSFFSIKNPNATANCGCGNSFSV